MNYLNRLAIIKNEIKNFYLLECNNNNLEEFYNKIAIYNVLPTLHELNSELEISYRQVLDELMQNNNEVITPTSSIFRLLNFTFEFTIKYCNVISNIHKIPFLMIEDVMDTQTIENAEILWDVIVILQSHISHEEIFSRGKLVILKACNSLLKKLSKSCNTVFRGRILLFLAFIYPLSEKSALNLSGKVNISNQTYYEEEHTFQDYINNSNVSKDIVTHENSNSSMEVVELLESSIVTANDILPSTNTNTTKVDDDITYDLYKSFWSLQSFFTTEGNKILEVLELWTDFINHSRKVVDLFEAYDYTDDELQQQIQNQDDSENLAYRGCKYLTSSQLFKLQLRDPAVRQQIAVQILFFLHYLRVKIIPLITVEHMQVISKDMLYLHDKACRLIERTPKDGKKLLAIIKQLLSREKRFINWKTSSCQSYEITKDKYNEKHKRKYPDIDLEKQSSNTFSLYKKRETISTSKKITSTNDLNTTNATTTSTIIENKIDNKVVSKQDNSLLLSNYVFDYSEGKVKEVAKQLVKNIPSYEDEIQQYIDAEDPDAGIEPEYHPKHDNLYCWRTRRLLASAGYLYAFEVMADGDIGKALRKINNIDEPTTVDTIVAIEPTSAITSTTILEPIDHIDNINDETIKDNNNNNNSNNNNNYNNDDEAVTTMKIETEEGEELE